MANPVAAETIGFSEIGTESAWRSAFSADVKAEAKLRQIDLRFADAQNNVEHQYEDVRRFIAEKLDAIVIAPTVVTGWTQVLKEAQAARIPVFIVDRAVDADPALFVSRIAADFNLEGRLAGAWLAQASGGRCLIVELQGTPGAAPTIDRRSGFSAVLGLFPGMRIISSETGGFTQEGGHSVMGKFILATNRLQGVCAVWAHNDDMMVGAIAAMQEAGLRPGRDILTISVDGVPGILQAMSAGKANASVELKVETGAYIFNVVQGYLRGNRGYPKWVVVPSDLHTQADAAATLGRRELR